jgi:hypothetical protein
LWPPRPPARPPTKPPSLRLLVLVFPCASTFCDNQQAVFSPCGHWSCPTRFLQNMDNAISSKKIVRLEGQAGGGGGEGGGGGGGGGGYTTGCVDPNCASVVQSNQCVNLLPLRKRDMFGRFATEAVVVGELHGEICPLPGCNEAIIDLPNEQSAMIVTCQACARRFCRCCNGLSLTGKCPAKEDNAEAEKMLAARGFVHCCPNCKCVAARGSFCCRWSE